jgi:hypothetical protein
LLVEGTTDHAIFMLSPEGLVLTWNAGAARIKGDATRWHTRRAIIIKSSRPSLRG